VECSLLLPVISSTIDLLIELNLPHPSLTDSNNAPPRHRSNPRFEPTWILIANDLIINGESDSAKSGPPCCVEQSGTTDWKWNTRICIMLNKLSSVLRVRFDSIHLSLE
jgi:hypothetical protein